MIEGVGETIQDHNPATDQPPADTADPTLPDKQSVRKAIREVVQDNYKEAPMGTSKAVIRRLEEGGWKGLTIDTEGLNSLVASTWSRLENEQQRKATKDHMQAQGVKAPNVLTKDQLDYLLGGIRARRAAAASPRELQAVSDTEMAREAADT